MKPNLKAIPAALCLTGLAVSTASAGINIDYVPVGNAGNPNDSTGYGGASYNYKIGTYEVTLTQYTAFLNAVAATDTHALYNPSMGTDLNIAGITRAGSSGAYSYTVAGNGNRPVTYVSFLDAMRFANWIDNGQGSGSTETGAYTLSLGGLAPRTAGASVFVASENEWYKAAYYDPTIAGANKYWLYATRSNSAPGNVVGAGANQANYYDHSWSVTQSTSYSSSQNYLTPAGSFSGSGSYYGTYDQDGNVTEWNDTIISGTDRGYRGGSWVDFSTLLQSANPGSAGPDLETSDLGFRLVIVPEPGTALFGIACVGVAALRRRRRA